MGLISVIPDSVVCVSDMAREEATSARKIAAYIGHSDFLLRAVGLTAVWRCISALDLA